MIPAVLAALSFAAVASAQANFATGGQGRFPCSSIVNGVVVVDRNVCATQASTGAAANPLCAVNPGDAGYGDVDGQGFKNYGAIPTGSTCTQDPLMPTNYYCGFAGSPCTSNDQCDNGSCDVPRGVCVGQLGDPCTADSDCSGNIYCLNSNAESTGQNICGYSDSTDGSGAICDDGCAAGNFLCISGACDDNSGSCFPSLVGASQRARSRRDVSPRGSRCPASHTACAVQGLAKGFECVDTTSNLEQCGACASAGGVDCTALPGVDAVGCVAGQCEIWACAESHVWDAATASCVLALVQ